jgi:hypothetical protein
MTAAQAATSLQATQAMPTVTHRHVDNGGYEPEYAIQLYSKDIADWRFFDCACTRVEADNLLASYRWRYAALGV